MASSSLISDMNALLTTLGLLIAYRGISLVLTGGTVQKVSDGMAALGETEILRVAAIWCS